MAINSVNISTNERLQLNGESVNSGTIDRKFGRPEDFIELHIYNQQNQLLISDYNFTQYKFPEGSTENLVSELNMDPVNILRLKGYTSGKYKLVFNIQRSKIFNTFEPPFSVKEISSTRRELRAITPKLTNEQLDPEVSRFIREIDAAAYLKDFVLNFNKDINIVGVNIALNKNTNKYEVLLKLIDPLPSDIKLSDSFRVVEEITDPLILNVDLGLESSEDEGIPLQGPNFKIDIRLNNSVPSSFKNYDEVLNYSLTSSYHNLLNHLENREIPDISYDFIRTVSGSNEGDPLEEVYHFENFTHFSSAVERLKNFEYKVKLIELYDSQTSDINDITGPTSASTYVLENKEAINEKKQNLIKGFDGYERFLYYTSGTFAWPKSGSEYPYVLYPVTSSEVKTWLGSEKDTFSNYGGQLLSASQFDRQNENALTRLVPNHIMDNSDNSFYSSFVNMVGQHFDQIWVHIKHLTEVNDAHHTRGISKELVYFSLKSLGLDTFDQFENSNLIEYILGEGTSGSVFYDTPQSQSLVTASMGSVPKSDITKNIWKRLYHNAPYLLKTKGTERGLRALMSCYGIPSTILNVKEYGGSTSDKTTYQTFTNEKSGLALKGDATSTSEYFIKTPWSSSLTNGLLPTAKTVEFRIKPYRSNNVYHLFSLTGSSNPQNNQFLSLEPYTENDISSSGDASQYGRLKWNRGSLASAETDEFPNGPLSIQEHVTNWFPVYNGDFWNISMGIDATQMYDATLSNLLSQEQTKTPIKISAYQSNHLKTCNYVTKQFVPKIIVTNLFEAWGLNASASFAYIGGAPTCYVGGAPINYQNGIHQYSGSLQEVRYHFGELLSDDTLKKHALEPFMYAGNSVSSSYENLVLRLPLGSNDKRDVLNNGDSFHPNQNVNYLVDDNFLNTPRGNIGDFSQFVDTGHPYLYDRSVFPYWRILTDANPKIQNGGARIQNDENGSQEYIDIQFDPDNQLGNLQTGSRYVLTYTILESNKSESLEIQGATSADSVTLNTTVGTHTVDFIPTKTLSTYPQIKIRTRGVGLPSIHNERNINIVINNLIIKEKTIESSITNQTFEEVVEEHYTPTPDTVGISTTSEKTRIDTGTIDDDWLSPTRKTETSTLDNQPPDYEDLGVFFSPTTEINEDIIYTLGAFRLDDYIGSPLPSQQTASRYEDLANIRDIYFKKVERRYNYWDYIKLIQYIDHTLFKLVEQWVPMKANLKTGLLIEPHYLERTKFARELPIIDDDQTMVNGSYNTINSEIEPNRSFNLTGSSVITTNNCTIDIDDYILDEPQNASQAPIKPFSSSSGKPAGYIAYKSSTLLGNVVKGRMSSRYHRKRSVGNNKETEY